MRILKTETMREQNIDEIVSMYNGIPMGDELPQVAGVNDILVDVYSDILNVPRDYAMAAMNHQFDDGLDYEDMIH